MLFPAADVKQTATDLVRRIADFEYKFLSVQIEEHDHGDPHLAFTVIVCLPHRLLAADVIRERDRFSELINCLAGTRDLPILRHDTFHGPGAMTPVRDLGILSEALIVLKPWGLASNPKLN